MAVQGCYTYEWPRPMVTVDAVVFCEFMDCERVLLILRGNEPYKDCWAVPGGFLEMDEELMDGAMRELQEETGLKGVSLKQCYTFGQIGRDPRGRLITVFYVGEVTVEQASLVRAGDDASQAEWFDVKALPNAMAFDHRDMVAKAYQVWQQQGARGNGKLF